MPVLLGRGKHTCTKVLGVGEVAMHENSDGSYRTVIGDGKTPVNELPTFSGESRTTLRDTFAAAALSGLIASEGSDSYLMQAFCYRAFAWADAMLRERGIANRDNCVTGNNPEMPYPVAEPMPQEKRAEVSDTLTDAEREALRIVSSVFPSEKHAATLRGLLDRLGGGR